MSWEGAKRSLLNMLAAFGGFSAGTWLGGSERIRSMVEKFVGTPPDRSATNAHRDDPGVKEEPSPLKGIKEYLQRKEGFRR